MGNLTDRTKQKLKKKTADNLEGLLLDYAGQADELQVDLDALEARVDTAESDIDTLQLDLGTAENDIDTLQIDLDAAEVDIVDNLDYVSPKIAVSVNLDDDPTLDANNQINWTFQVNADADGILDFTNLVSGDVVNIYVTNAATPRAITFSNVTYTNQFSTDEADAVANLFTTSEASDILFSGLVVGTTISWVKKYY